MKMKNIILSLGLGLSLSSSVLGAANNAASYLELYRDSAARPKPVSIVWPTVSTDDIGTDLSLLIEVDANGRPGRITSQTRVRPELMRALRSAVSRWEFVPRTDANGQPIKAKVHLPVGIR